MLPRFVAFLLLLSAANCASVLAQSAEKKGEPFVPKDGLVLAPAGQAGRSPVHTDAVEAEIVAGRFSAPKARDTVVLAGGKKAQWQRIEPDKDGIFKHASLRGGYAYFNVPSDAERVMMLEAAGHAMVYVNGEPRAGDIYSTGYVHLPVLLKKGDNQLLFLAGRGTLKWRLTEPPAELFILPLDGRLPDLVGDETEQVLGSLIVVNASMKPQLCKLVVTQLGGTANPSAMKKGDRFLTVPPLGVRKMPVTISPIAMKRTEKVPVEIAVVGSSSGNDARPSADKSTRFRGEIALRKSTENHVRTFVSDIDGSVQYYAVAPAKPLQERGPSPALFLSLHGAGVEATGQAAAYASKTWGHLIAATNRRPYGFDWEDWGRLDAMEVLEHAQKQYQTDPQRTYLTGHSMGGHGTWHVGVTYPDRFAAIGPSAGWVSFWTYGGGKRQEDKTPIQSLLRRATNGSDTLGLAKNYLHEGVYVLHGDADNNVPVAQARMMKKFLEPFHKDFHYFEQPKAGHWWSNTDEPGSACVDWAPMFDLFAHRAIPRRDEIREIGFITANPGVSGQCHWLTINSQIKHLEFSNVQVRLDPVKRRFVGTTENVAVLCLDLAHLEAGKELAVELDGVKIASIAWPKDGKLWLARSGSEWKVAEKPSLGDKGPHRYGPLRDAFRHRMQFVYGTKGTPEENAWAYAKARFDAESFWYRGNGSIDVFPDDGFNQNEDLNRSVILYGNADTNSAWAGLLGKSDVQVKNGAVNIGQRTEKGDDLACMFLMPRPGSDIACVAAITGTGLKGMRLTDRLPIFGPGVGYPDCIVIGPEMLTESFEGVRAAGYFGTDWKVEGGQFAWRESKAEK